MNKEKRLAVAAILIGLAVGFSLIYLSEAIISNSNAANGQTCQTFTSPEQVVLAYTTGLISHNQTYQITLYPNETSVWCLK